MDSIWIFWLFLIGWFGFMMWQSWQSRQQRQKLVMGLQVGDEVTSSGGIIGRIVELRADRALLEAGPNTRLWILRQAIIGRARSSGGDDPYVA